MKFLKNQRGAVPVFVILGIYFFLGMAAIHANDCVKGTNHLGEIAEKVGNALECDSDMPCIKCHSQEKIEKFQAQ